MGAFVSILARPNSDAASVLDYFCNGLNFVLQIAIAMRNV